MRFLIIGAGGIGCYYGAKLQNAGHCVRYLARGEHLLAMQKQGLQVSHETFQFGEAVQAFDVPQLLATHLPEHYDLIILTTKSGATAAILADLKPWLGADCPPFLSLQNGVDNEPLIANVVGVNKTLGGLGVRISGHIISPGKVEVTGLAQIIMGPWPNSERYSAAEVESIDDIVTQFKCANIPTQLSANIQHELWRKLIINNGINPLSALTGLDTQALTCHATLTKIVYQLMAEVACVAKADNVELTKNDVDEMYDLICNFAAIKTSMLVDKEKGNPLELDSICGAVLQRAAKLGIETPQTELVSALLQLQE